MYATITVTVAGFSLPSPQIHKRTSMTPAANGRGHGRHRSEGGGVAGPLRATAPAPRKDGAAARPAPPAPAPAPAPVPSPGGAALSRLTRVASPSQLVALPPELLSGDADRPLLHVDEAGNEYKYYLDPMRRAVFFILLVEMLERFSFYGINYTATAYLTGQ